jgi:hypothetical protein
MRLLMLLAGLLPALALAQLPAPSALAVPPAAAVNPNNPYEAIVPVATPGAEATALREALATVLAAVTGLTDIRTNAVALAVLDRAPQLVQRYGTEQDALTQATMYRAAFDARAVDEALKRQGLPVFGVVAGAEQEWPVEVRGVASFRDYGRVLTSLRKLRGVRHVSVRGSVADRVQISVRFEGDAQALARAIGADASFAPAGTAGAALMFTLRPGA